MTDTIFALSSGAPPAAIGVIRISGPRASDALTELAGGLPVARDLAPLGYDITLFDDHHFPERAPSGIEEIALAHPDKVARMQVDVGTGLLDFQARDLVRRKGATHRLRRRCR